MMTVMLLHGAITCKRFMGLLNHSTKRTHFLLYSFPIFVNICYHFITVHQITPQTSRSRLEGYKICFAKLLSHFTKIFPFIQCVLE